MKKWLKENRGLWWLLGGCFITFTLFIFLAKLLLPSKTNVFADYAEVVNGLFSAFAFAGLIYAVFLQKNELELQREELKQTREELEGQKKEFEQQNETLKRQRFENTFFNMLSLQQEIVNGLAYKYEESETIGKEVNGREIRRNATRTISSREVFSYLYMKEYIHILTEPNTLFSADSLIEALSEHGTTRLINDHKTNSNNIEANDYQQKYLDVFEIYESSDLPSYFDHYFRHLYRIIKFVDESPLLPSSFEDRYHYTGIVRAQLSRYELVWLFYNGLSSYGEEKFKLLIERYALLKNIRFELLAKLEHKELYGSSAYQKIKS